MVWGKGAYLLFSIPVFSDLKPLFRKVFSFPIELPSCLLIIGHMWVDLLLFSLFCFIDLFANSSLDTVASQWVLERLGKVLQLCFLQDCFDSSKSFAFQNFIASVFIIYTKNSWNFNHVYVQSVDQFGEHWHLRIESSISEQL